MTFDQLSNTITTIVLVLALVIGLVTVWRAYQQLVERMLGLQMARIVDLQNEIRALKNSDNTPVFIVDRQRQPQQRAG